MSHHKTPNLALSRTIGFTAALLLGLASLACRADPDVLASNESDGSMLDIEFDTASKTPRYTYCQPSVGGGGAGTLFAGMINAAGNLNPPVPVGPCLFQGNGPEWGRDSSGSFVTYMGYDGAGNPTVKFIRPPASGATGWTPQQVAGLPVLASPNVAYASQFAGSTGRVVFMAQANNGTLTTQGLAGAFQCSLLTQGLTGNFPRFSAYENVLLYTKVTGGARQVFKANMTTCSSTALVNDGVDKTTASAWTAPELGSGVYGVLVGNNNEATEYRVYRADNNALWATLAAAEGRAYSSVETFQHGGASYLLYAVQSAGLGTSIYVANIGTGVTRKMSGSQVMLRSEPEVGFLPDGTPRIYFSATSPGGVSNAVYRTAVTSLP